MSMSKNTFRNKYREPNALLLGLLLFGLACSYTRPAEAGAEEGTHSPIEYLSAFGDRVRFRYNRAKILTFGGDGHGDLRFGLTDCASREFPICHESNSFTFALPDTELSEGQSWVYKDYTFLVREKKSVQLFGIEKYVWHIESVFADYVDTFFYFSDTDGLVAFSISVADELPDMTTGDVRTVLSRLTFWLSSEKGLYSLCNEAK